MNLGKLFEIQRKLDEHIEQNHPRQEGEDRLAKKILALQVELGELANEWRGFKFWSNNQEPRINEITWPYGAGGPPVYRNKVLEEYVDCLHFILSIGLELELEELNFHPNHSKMQDVVKLFIGINSLVGSFTYNYAIHEENYAVLVSKFHRLGELLGFTWEQVEQAYLQKNEENHARQENGY